MKTKIICVESLWNWIHIQSAEKKFPFDSKLQFTMHKLCNLLQCSVICHFSRIHRIFQAIKCLKIMQHWCMLSLFFFANVWVTFSRSKQGWFINWINSNILHLCVCLWLWKLHLLPDSKCCIQTKYLSKLNSCHLTALDWCKELQRLLQEHNSPANTSTGVQCCQQLATKLHLQILIQKVKTSHHWKPV